MRRRRAPGKQPVGRAEELHLLEPRRVASMRIHQGRAGLSPGPRRIIVASFAFFSTSPLTWRHIFVSIFTSICSAALHRRTQYAVRWRVIASMPQPCKQTGAIAPSSTRHPWLREVHGTTRRARGSFSRIRDERCASYDLSD